MEKIVKKQKIDEKKLRLVIVQNLSKKLLLLKLIFYDFKINKSEF